MKYKEAVLRNTGDINSTLRWNVRWPKMQKYDVQKAHKQHDRVCSHVAAYSWLCWSFIKLSS